MRQGSLRGPLLALVSLLLLAGSGYAQTSPPARTGEIIVKFRASASAADRAAILADLGADGVTTLPRIAASHARIQKATVDEAIRRYRGNSKVEFIEPNYVYHALKTPNDTLFTNLWGLQNTGQNGGTPGADVSATKAWDLTTGSSSVLVAIIDTGIDYNHPDLAANVYANPGEIPANGIDDDGNGFADDVHGYDFVNNDSNPQDDNGHGTHVSGTVGAIGNNTRGVVGLDWQTRLMAVKFLDAGGNGTSEDAIRAIDYAVTMGARVINASWGGGAPSEALRQAIQSAGDAGCLFVAAAGNTGSDNDVFPTYPASYDLPTILSVAASDMNDQKPSWSNWGKTSVDLAAPGDNILSTLPNGQYGTLSGTSMATPHVTGTVALVLSRFPNIGPVDAKNLILQRVDAVPAFANLVATGGRLNSFLAVGDPDVAPPGPISDLSVSEVNGTRVVLGWTATGDDGVNGICAAYDLRYSTTAIDAANFASATKAGGTPHPAAAGTPERFELAGLPFGTHLYFALEALDEFGNASPLSNVVSTTTLGPPEIAVSPPSLSASLLTGQRTTQVLTIRNAGPAELHVRIQPQQVAPAGATMVERTFAIPAATAENAAAVTAEQAPRPYPPSASPYAAGHQPIRQPLSVSDIRIANVQSSSARILILTSQADITEIRNLLSGFSDLGPIDVLDGGTSVPTLAQLAPYQSILLVVNVPFSNPDGIGNVLADYVDSGGGLVLTLASFIGGWDVRGRLRSDGYIPFTLGGGPIGGANLGSFDATHPIMAGVTAARGELLGAVGLTSGASLVASWANGQPCVATKGTVAAVNLFVAFSGFWSGDVPLMLHNALLWSSTGSWLSTEPREAVVPAGGQLGAVVTFDATDLDGGDYQGAVSVTSDDPIHGLIKVPTSLHVTGVADISIQGDAVSVESTQEYVTDGGSTTHHLALDAPPPPSTSGTFDLEVRGDYGDFVESATLRVEGVTLGSVGATGVDCALGQGSFPVGAAQLAAFLADGKVDAEVQNTQDVGIFCTTNTHTVRLRYQSPADHLAFGDVFVAGSRALGIVVRNSGSNPLVVSSITATNAAFSALPSSFTLGARATQRVLVTFHPGQAISYAASLRIASDDPDEPLLLIPLSGMGLVAPDITVNPVSFQETLRSGDHLARSLTVRNDGGSDLEWAITVEPSGAGSLPVLPVPKLTLPPALPPPPPAITDATPSGAAAARTSATATSAAGGFPGGLEYGALRSNQAPPRYAAVPARAFTMSGATVLLVQDMQPWGTTSNEAVLQAQHLSFDVVTTAALAGVKLLAYQKVIVASDQPTATYQALAARMGQISDFVNAGGVLEFHAAGWGFNNGDASLVTLPGGMEIGLLTSSYSYFFQSHPLLTGVPSPLEGMIVSHAVFSDLPQGALVLGVNEFNQPVYVTYPMGHGLVIATGHVMEYGYAQGNVVGRLLVNAVPFGLAGPASWLAASPLTGHVAPGASAEVTVDFRTAGLLGGDYVADLVLRTNDPDESTLRVPASMHVDPAPDIVVSGVVDSVQSVKDFLVDGAVTTHDLPVEVLPASDGIFELTAQGDYGDFVETATLEVEGIRLGSVGRTGTDCAPAFGTFILPAADLARVAADGLVRVTVTNSIDVGAFCPVNQHVVRLVYTGRADRIDFGRVFVGASAQREIEITNRGLDPLHVQALGLTNANFHVGLSGALEVAARSTLVVPLSFEPTTAAALVGVLAIHNDDPDQPEVDVDLSGEGLVPPDIAVTPDHESEHLFSGQRVERTLTIANEGGAELTFRLGLESTPGAGASLSLAHAGATGWALAAPAPKGVHPPVHKGGDGTSGAPSGAGSLEGVLVPSNAPGFHAQAAHPSTMAGATVLLVEDTLPWGIPANEQLLAANGIAYDVIPAASLGTMELSSYLKVIVASDQPTFTYLQIQAAMSHLAEYVSSGGTLEFHAAGAGFSEGDPSVVTLPGGVRIARHLSNRNFVLVPNHPLVAGVPSPFEGNFASHSSLAAFPAHAIYVVADDAGSPNLVVYPFGTGTVIASGQTLEYGFGSGQPTGQILRNMIPFRGSVLRPEWLSASPPEGTVAPGGHATITLGLDAGELAGGDYQARVIVSSNDPDEPQVVVPVQLAVTAAPDIAVLGAPADLSSTQLYDTDGARTVHDLAAPTRPEGSGILELAANGDLGDLLETATAYLEGIRIGEVGRSGFDCTVASGQFKIAAADLATAAADGVLRVEVQNTPDVNPSCTLNQHAVRILYRAAASPLSFGTIFLGQCATQHLLLVNRGSDVMTLQSLTVSDAAFQAVLPPGEDLSLAPHDSVDVAVTFCPLYGLALEAQLVFTSNDPDEPHKVIVLRGEGVAPPDVAVAPASIAQALLRDQEATVHLLMANDGGSPLEYQVSIGSAPAAAAGAARVSAGTATSLSAQAVAAARGRYAENTAPSPPSAVRPGGAAARAAPAMLDPGLHANDVLWFFDDMESGVNGWTHTALGPDGLDQWIMDLLRSSSGTWSWRVTPHFGSGSEALRSPAIDLRTAMKPMLTFRTWYDFDDCGGLSDFEPDGGIVEVGDENGNHWTQIFPVNGYPYVLDDICGNPLALLPAYAHESRSGGTFDTETFDLSAYSGHRIRLRFRAGWDCGNCEYPDGWFIDDVRVFSEAPSWARTEPSSGTILPGSVTDMAVVLDAAGLNPGTYHASLHIGSNDPDEPLVEVPLQLLVADFAAAIDPDPNTMNLGSRGQTMTTYLELPDGMNPSGVVLSSLRVNYVAPSDGQPRAVGDYDHDGVPDLTLKFPFDAIRPTLTPGPALPVVLTGALADGRTFLGLENVRAIRHQITSPNGGEVVAAGSSEHLAWSLPAGWNGVTSDLFVSVNDGASWQPIATGVSGSAYTWTVAGRASKQALVRVDVRDASGLLDSDVSDRVFEIRATPTLVDPAPAPPSVLTLRNVPNPFSSAGTEIVFGLPREGPVTLTVYSATGRRVRVLVRESRAPGLHRVNWDGRDERGVLLGSGVYFLRLTTTEGDRTRRVALVR